ncbi:MAG: hypothetical protein ACI8Z0_002392 [Lentimonas sp.]|jgi:hypothetical protein
MTESKWLGIDAPSGLMKLSVISPHKKTLSEKEFIRGPMQFEEFSFEEKVRLRKAYECFFRRYLAHTSEMHWEADRFKPKAVERLDEHIEKFLSEKEFSNYIDYDNGLIFVADWYLEVLVYSVNDFSLEGSPRLFQRTQNVPTSWEETNWAE